MQGYLNTKPWFGKSFDPFIEVMLIRCEEAKTERQSGRCAARNWTKEALDQKVTVYCHQLLVQHYERERSNTSQSSKEQSANNPGIHSFHIRIKPPFLRFSADFAFTQNQCRENQVSDCSKRKHCFSKSALRLETWSESGPHSTGARLFVDLFDCPRQVCGAHNREGRDAWAAFQGQCGLDSWSIAVLPFHC
jgi:hypothetical protein